MTSEVIEFRRKAQGRVLAEYYNSWERVEIIRGPLGSGKTVESCQKLLRAMCNQYPNKERIRPSRWYAVRNTYSDLTRTTIKDWMELFSDLGRYVEGNKTPPTHHIKFNLDDGTTVVSEVVFIALDRPDSIKKLRGAQVTGFWLNEVKELSKPVVDMCDLRHGRYPSNAAGGIKSTWHGMIGDTNSPDEDHWLYKLAEEIRPEGWRFHTQPGGLIKSGDTYIENPNAENIRNLPEGYYIRGMQGKSKDWINVNLCNEYGFVANGKPVYPQYIDSVHCLPDVYEPNPSLPIILGCDFGRTPAASFLQFMPHIGRYIAFDEFCTEDMSAVTFAPELRAYMDRNYPEFTFAKGGGDPAGDSKGQGTDETPFTILHNHNIPVYPVRTNSPLVRRSSIVNLLKTLCIDGKPAFMVSPKCKMLRKGLAGGFTYRRLQVVGDEKYTDEPDKNIFSHICEANEYGLMSAGEGVNRQIENKHKNVTPIPIANRW